MPAFCASRSMSATTSGSGIGLRSSRVAIPALARLLPEPSHLDQRVGHERLARARLLELVQFLPHAPRDVEAAHVVHGEDAHRHAPVGQHAIDLLGRCAVLDEELRLVHVGEHHPVADEPGTVAHGDADFAQPLRERQRGREHARARCRPAHDFDQPHHVRRAEEVQADDRLGPRVSPAISSMSSVDVLVARMQPGLAAASSAANTCFFSARFSKTASITRSAPQRRRTRLLVNPADPPLDVFRRTGGRA